MVEKPLNDPDPDDMLGGALGDTAAFGRAIAAWLPTAEPDGRQFFAVDRSPRPWPVPVAGWLSEALAWPLAIEAARHRWRERTGGSVRWDAREPIDGWLCLRVVFHVGAWSWARPERVENFGGTVSDGDALLDDLDAATLAWVDAGCPRD